jgi:hypothetical protein
VRKIVINIKVDIEIDLKEVLLTILDNKRIVSKLNIVKRVDKHTLDILRIVAAINRELESNILA